MFEIRDCQFSRGHTPTSKSVAHPISVDLVNVNLVNLVISVNVFFRLNRLNIKSVMTRQKEVKRDEKTKLTRLPRT